MPSPPKAPKPMPKPAPKPAAATPATPATPAPAPTLGPSPLPAREGLVTVSACDMLMGDSGSGKTSLLATFAAWVWRTHKKVTLLYSADPGGWTTEVQTLINRGVIRVWKVTTRDPEDRLGLAHETCIRAAQGYWPKAFEDLEKGRTAPGVELVCPIVYEFVLHCPKGHVVRKVSAEGLLAGTFLCAPDGNPQACGLQVSLKSGAKVIRLTRQMKGFEQVGARAFDGITSMCAWAMRDLQDRGTKVELGERDALRSAIRIQSGDITLGSSSIAHFGQVQSLAERMINAAGAIPDQVARPIWTALEKRGTDDKSQLVVYGPDLPGNAKTAVVPQWVGNLFGVAAVPDEHGKSEWRMYLRRYYLPGDPVPHLAKTRVAPGYLPEYLGDGRVDDVGNPVSGIPPFTEFNLGHFYELEAAALRKQQEDTDLLYADAPGLVNVEMGEARIAEGTGIVVGLPSAPQPAPMASAGPRAMPAPQVARPAAPAAPAPLAPVQAAVAAAVDALAAAVDVATGPKLVPPPGPRPPAAVAPRPK